MYIHLSYTCTPVHRVPDVQSQPCYSARDHYSITSRSGTTKQLSLPQMKCTKIMIEIDEMLQ